MCSSSRADGRAIVERVVDQITAGSDHVRPRQSLRFARHGVLHARRERVVRDDVKTVAAYLGNTRQRSAEPPTSIPA